MKVQLSLVMIIILFCDGQSFAQLNRSVAVPLKKPINTTSMAPVSRMQNLTKPKPAITPQTPPTNLQKAVINIVVGDDGKDKDTYFRILVNDNNKRTACYFGQEMNGSVYPAGGGEYFTGDNETLPMNLEASVPTGEMKQVGALPLPVLRQAGLSDFINNGGSLQLNIFPNGHDTWKIKSLSLSLYFNNDNNTPHKITWNSITVSQDSRYKMLEFDKNFNPIQ